MTESPKQNGPGGFFGTLLSRSMVSDHFTGQIAEPTFIGAETYSGALYHIQLIPGEPQKYTFEGEIYWIRPAEASVNGGLKTGTFAGFNMDIGAFILLNRGDDGEFIFVRRSSSLRRILLLAE